MTDVMAVRKRDGRCYELAFRFLLDYAPDSTLVHGTIWSEVLGLWMGHAWVEFENHNYIYEPVKNTVLTRDWWEKNVKTKGTTRRYSLDEASKYAVKLGHYGNWMDDAGNEIPLKRARGLRREAQANLQRTAGKDSGA